GADLKDGSDPCTPAAADTAGTHSTRRTAPGRDHQSSHVTGAGRRRLPHVRPQGTDLTQGHSPPLTSRGDTAMPQGDKDKYTVKQKRKAEHIEKSYERTGESVKAAEARAWATVNKKCDGVT